MLLIRNAVIFQLPPWSAARLDEFMRDARDVLGEKTKDPGPLEMESVGWDEVYPGVGYAFPSGPSALYLRQRIARRALPRRAVAYEVSKRVKELESERDKRVGGRERKRITDEVMLEMLPNAPIVPTTVLGLIDIKRGLLIVDTGSRRAAEAWLEFLRKTVEALPSRPLDPEESPSAQMTAWVTNPNADVVGLPDGFTLADSAVLADPAERGAVVRCTRHDLESEEVREHLKAGKQVRRLALFHAGRLAFELLDDLRLAKLGVLDMVAEQFNEEERQNAAEEWAARAAITHLMLGELYDALAKALGLRDYEAARHAEVA